MEQSGQRLLAATGRSLTKFRISNHKLKFETGRYSKHITPLENRICEKCFFR